MKTMYLWIRKTQFSSMWVNALEAMISKKYRGRVRVRQVAASVARERGLPLLRDNDEGKRQWGMV